MERCPNCGASIRTGARFCTACGFRLLTPSESTVVAPTAVDTRAVVSARPLSEAPSPDSERVVWHGNTGPDQEANVDASDSVQPAPGSNSDDSTTVVPKDGPGFANDDAVPDDQAIVPSAGSLWSETESDAAGNEISDHASETVSDGDTGIAGDGTTEFSLDFGNRTGQAPSMFEATPESEAVNDEHSDPEVPDPVGPSESTSESSIGSTVETTPDDLDPYRSTGASAEHGDHPSETEGTDPEIESIDQGTASVDENGAPSDEMADGLATITDGSANIQPIRQDDVVIGTSFLAEKAQPGYYDEDGQRPSLTGEVEQATPPMRPASDPSGDDMPVAVNADSEPGEAARDPISSVTESNTPSGREDEWEPWGAGGIDDVQLTGDIGGDTSGLPINQPGSDPANPHEDDGGVTALAEARGLLDQLRTVFDSLEQSVTQSTVDLAVDSGSDSLAEIGQILDGFPSPAVDAERLAEVTRLAEDLSGRDYDIRALQHFAHERETILSLAAEVQQLRDVLDQIRSVLAQSSS